MQREQEKRSRARAKQEKRLTRREDGPEDDDETVTTTPEDQASILEALAQLHEDLAEGRVSLEIFEARQEELRSSIRID
jgi:hypothetical protein